MLTSTPTADQGKNVNRGYSCTVTPTARCLTGSCSGIVTVEDKDMHIGWACPTKAKVSNMGLLSYKHPNSMVV